MTQNTAPPGIEHILSALPPLATEERTFGIGSSVPKAKVHRYSMLISGLGIGNRKRALTGYEAAPYESRRKATPFKGGN